MTSITISLQAGVKADLDWTQAIGKAHEASEQGNKLFWELELGLFNKLLHPLAHQSQFLSLALSLDHFRERIWEEFGPVSEGVSLYTGNIDYSKTFPWDDAQHANFLGWCKEHACPENERSKALYCRDAATDYLRLLAARLPDAIPTYVTLNADRVDDLEVTAQLLNVECYEPIKLKIFNSPFGNADSTIALCIPPSTSTLSKAPPNLKEALQTLIAKNLRPRLIPEENLISEWDGLDTLLVCSDYVTASGRRKLLGFCAAGGQIVTLGQPLGLPLELPFNEYSPQSETVPSTPLPENN